MITLITGTPGTGKTAFIVSQLEKEIASGRKVFTNITGLKLPHYKLGRMSEWQKGTWLHIDRYVRTAPDNALLSQLNKEDDLDDIEIEKNWETNPNVVTNEDGSLSIRVFDSHGELIGLVPYESHKGALIVFDECQNGFRPRPNGSAVPDSVAALEVHRKQGLDFWFITQRPTQVDSNLRGLCGKHIALRVTYLGRFKYEWPEVSDVESKLARDTAARTRYKLPSHVFKLYESAEVHTKHKHSVPIMAKALFIVVPVFLYLAWTTMNTIKGKTENPSPPVAEISGPIVNATYPAPVVASSVPEVAQSFGMTITDPTRIGNQHPFSKHQLSITARIQTPTRDLYRFLASENGMPSFSISSSELVAAGYTITPINDCSVKLEHGSTAFFVTCSASPVQQVSAPLPPMVELPADGSAQ